jgi:hypothetical protein
MYDFLKKDLTSEQVVSSYRNLFSVFRENSIPYERILEIIDYSEPENFMCALKKINDLSYKTPGKSGFDFGYLCGDGKVRSLLECYANEKNPNIILAMVTTYDNSKPYLNCNIEGFFWQARCFALRKEILDIVESDQIRTNSQIEVY